MRYFKKWFDRLANSNALFIRNEETENQNYQVSGWLKIISVFSWSIKQPLTRVPPLSIWASFYLIFSWQKGICMTQRYLIFKKKWCQKKFIRFYLILKIRFPGKDTQSEWKVQSAHNQKYIDQINYRFSLKIT